MNPVAENGAEDRGTALIPMANRTFKRRRDVTEEDILALAKEDYYGISEKIDESDLKSLLALAAEARLDAEMWSHRRELIQGKVREFAENGRSRSVPGVLMNIRSWDADAHLNMAKTRHDCLVDAYESARQLMGIQGRSRDIVELYRIYVTEANFSSQMEWVEE